MKQYELDGSPIVYYVSGRDKNEWILFIHAAFVNHGMFQTQIDYFSDKYNVLTLDILGHGKSTKTQKENSISQLFMMLKAIFSITWFAKSNKKISAYTLQAQNDFYEMNIRFPKKSFMYLASLSSMVNVRKSKPRKYPLLVGCGKYDIPTELSAIEMWKQNEPQCKVIIFEEAGHCVNMDAPQQFNAAMEEFWSRKNA